MAAIRSRDSKCFALQACGGTGKTYTVNLILDTVRSTGDIALACAMSGIAGTLLHRGRTLHSTCKVPININEDSTCGFTKRDATGWQDCTEFFFLPLFSKSFLYATDCYCSTLKIINNQIYCPTGVSLARAKLLVIDEVSTGHKHVSEALDRSLRYVRGEKQKLFGGLTVLFATDWRQCLPIIPRGGRGQIVNACLKSSCI